ncbi:MAG: hypothetical protein Q8K97_12375 [Pseudohongiella sp.]|nr:hypothetical protein [Pseudohongiella sp.]
MKTTGTDLRRAAEHLRTTGVGASDRRLRELLVTQGVIRKTEFGYEVTPRYRDAGMLTTEIRQHRIITPIGHQIDRHYTVVVVTQDGLSWLRSLVMDQGTLKRVAS